MKKAKKTFDIVTIPLKLIIIALMIFGSYEYLNKVFINKEVNYGNSFHALPENSLDVVVLGSSHAQYSFDPVFFYENTGLYSYNLGSPCQPYEVSYQFLKETLKTQKPKLAIMELYTSIPISYGCGEVGCYVQAQYQMTGEEKYATIDYLEEDLAKEYYNDFLNYHNDWRTIEDYRSVLPQNALKKPSLSDIDLEFGYVYNWTLSHDLPDNWWFSTKAEPDLNVELRQKDLDALNDILELCRKNDIELLLYTVPMDGLDSENLGFFKKVFDWADANAVPYVDFIHQDEELEMYLHIHLDSSHANILGANIITNCLSEAVKGGYEFDHRINDDLESLYSEYSSYHLTYVIDYESNPRHYLERAKEFKGYTMLSFDSVSLSNETTGRYLHSFGLFEPGVAVVHDGELIQYDSNYIELVIDDHSFVLSRSSLVYDGEESPVKSDLDAIFVDKYMNCADKVRTTVTDGVAWKRNAENYIRHYY